MILRKACSLREKFFLLPPSSLLLFFILVLERDGRFYIVNSWRIWRKLQLGQDGIDHVLLSFEQVSQKNFVLNKLRCFACQIGLAAREEFLKALARFSPVFFEERNLRQVKARIPKLRIDSLGFQQGYSALS